MESIKSKMVKFWGTTSQYTTEKNSIEFQLKGGDVLRLDVYSKMVFAYFGELSYKAAILVLEHEGKELTYTYLPNECGKRIETWLTDMFEFLEKNYKVEI